MMFAGKAALVTGAGSGIGAVTAQRLAQEGAAVALVDINLENAEAIAARITAAGGKAVAIRADIGEDHGSRDAFDQAEAALGELDVAFLNAGVLQPYGPFDDLTLEVFDRVMAINLRGAFLGMKEAQRRLRPGGAAAVTSSAAGLTGFTDAAAYSASKHGVIGLVRSASRDFARRGLRINAICPGMVGTPMNGIDTALDMANPDTLTPPPYRGLMDAQVIAEVALFLLSGRAAGVNGQAQLVDAALLSAFPELG